MSFGKIEAPTTSVAPTTQPLPPGVLLLDDFKDPTNDRRLGFSAGRREFCVQSARAVTMGAVGRVALTTSADLHFGGAAFGAVPELVDAKAA